MKQVCICPELTAGFFTELSARGHLPPKKIGKRFSDFVNEHEKKIILPEVSGHYSVDS
jgi:hypothetical protein